MSETAKLIARLRNPCWAYDDAGQDLPYITPEDGEKAAAEIEALQRQLAESVAGETSRVKRDQ